MVNYRKIKALREKNFKVAEFAEKIGISQAAQSYIELGYRNPSAEVLKRIADNLGVTVDALFFEPDDDAPAADTSIDRQAD
jgi:transcriptional regulator with XRE-family HTH domain